jgi:hypothetical protein
MTHDLDKKPTGHLQADIRGSMNTLLAEVIGDEYESDPTKLDELETEARAIAECAEELAFRHRHKEGDE